jgi:dynein heavy chain 1
MVDPSDQGTSFLQSALSGQKLVKSSLVDDSFIKHLESAMRFGTPLLITDVESIDQVNLARHFFLGL